MSQKRYASPCSDKFIRLQQLAVNESWLLSWSRHLPEFQRVAIAENELAFLALLKGQGVPSCHWFKDETEQLMSPGKLPVNCVEIELESQCCVWLAEINPEDLSLEQKFSLAKAITQALSFLHSADVFHFALRPGSFIVTKDFTYAEVIGFSEAKTCSRQALGVSSFIPSHVDGFFLAPELSYLHEILLDNRSDLYALGCVLYWLFSHQLPFSEIKDISQLSYAHMSKPLCLPPLGLACSDQEKALSEVIAKLVEKEPDTRYQSCAGVLADLTQVSLLHQASGFVVGSQDVYDRMVIPQKLYGRESQVNTLMSGYHRVAAGGSEALLIGGYSGVGKSALVDEVRRPIIQANGLFIFGKFEQYQRQTPYSAISQAFNRFIDIILSYSDDEVQAWKQKFNQVLGNNAQVVIDIVPSLSSLLGEVPIPQALGADEQQNRFNKTFLAFVRQICSVHRPLVLFIDDLQWADSASINLLKLLLSDKDGQYCFIIGAYRDNEVDERHPFIRMLNSVNTQELRISQLTLTGLSPAVISQIVADTLKQDADKIRDLAKLIYDKTAGNPFFFKQFMFELYRSQLLRFSYNKVAWTWSMQEIEQQSITDNVVELVTRQLTRLSKSSELLLQQAACIGSIFSVDLLASVDNRDAEQVQNELKECVDAGLIRPLSERKAGHSQADLSYKFTHDRVQQAAYAGNSEYQRQEVHYHIGCQLLQAWSEEEVREGCFELVAHLNAAKAQLSPELTARVMVLNYQAALKAKAATAYETGISYLDSLFSYDISLCGDKENDEKMPILLAPLKAADSEDYTSLARMEKLECLYLAGQYDVAEQYKSSVASCCDTLALKVRFATILITQYTRYGQLQRAIDEGLNALKLLNSPLPATPEMQDIGKAIEESQAILAKMGFAELAQQTDIESQQVLLTLDVLMAMQPCCYNSGSLLFPLTILSLFKLTYQHGNSPYSSYVFMMYALLCTKVLKAYPLAFEAAKQSDMIAQRYPSNPVLEGRLLMMKSNFVLPWQSKLQLSYEMRNQAYHLCVENGDYYWGVHAYIFGFYADLISAPSLPQLLERSRNVVATCELIKQPAQTYLSQLQCNFIEILQGSLDNLTNLDHQAGYEAQALQHFIDNHYMCGTYDRMLARLLQGYLFEHYQQALSISLAPDLSPEQLDEGIFHEAVYTQFNLLCILALKQTEPDALQPHHQTWFESAWQKYQLWYQTNPDNFEPGYYLILAEQAVVEADEMSALCHYERAILSASRAGFALYQALASERCGRYRALLGQDAIATGYLQQAKEVYHSWGAHAKALHVEEKLKALSANKTGLESYHPNWESIVSASQDISSPLSRDELINRMLQRGATTTGAQHVGLYLKQDNLWSLSALCQEGRILEVHSQPESMPSAILNYCLNSRSTLVLADAHREGDYMMDTHIKANKVRSVLALPLLVREEIVGVLYLEHNEVTNMFTGQRCQVMELLTNQFAITYQNADFYKQLEQQNEALEAAVADRTQDLHRQNQHLESILQALPIPYVITQPGGKLVRANELFYECFEVTPAEFAQSTVLSFYQHTKDRERMFAQLDKLGVLSDFECEMQTYSGKPFWAQFSVTRVNLESGPGVFAAIKDISGRKHKEQLLEHQASTDPLTGAYNRRGFEQLAQGLLVNQRVQTLSVAILDLDKFKLLNDTYGHSAGDKVLKQFTQSLQSHLRDDDILGRIGGEEFAIILSGVGLKQAEKVMQRITALTEKTPVPWQEEQITFTVSIGIAQRGEMESLEAMIKRADKALYQAKAAGRNCVKLAN